MLAISPKVGGEPFRETAKIFPKIISEIKTKFPGKIFAERANEKKIPQPSGGEGRVFSLNWFDPNLARYIVGVSQDEVQETP